MTDIVLSKRGRLFFILPLILVAVTTAFLFSSYFTNVLNCEIKIEDKVSKRNKTVIQTFEVEHIGIVEM
ncbi:MAG: hypothetical protein ACOC87_00940 [Candidatus Natronoplasma sp.]